MINIQQQQQQEPKRKRWKAYDSAWECGRGFIWFLSNVWGFFSFYVSFTTTESPLQAMKHRIYMRKVSKWFLEDIFRRWRWHESFGWVNEINFFFPYTYLIFIYSSWKVFCLQLAPTSHPFLSPTINNIFFLASNIASHVYIHRKRNILLAFTADCVCMVW